MHTVDERGPRVGPYEILLPLGAGRTTNAYIARRLPAGSGRVVVLKRVHRALLRDRGFCNLFRQEARLASLVRHPNVVAVDEVLDETGELALVEPYIESFSLRQLLVLVEGGGARPSAPVAVRMMADVLAGLAEAHRVRDDRAPKGVFHRDATPDNVLVGVNGETSICDFAMARTRERLTKAAAATKKATYFSPEQLARDDLDGRADQYAVALMLVEALTRARPVSSETGELLSDHGLGQLPGTLGSVIERALAKDKDDRFASATAFRDALIEAVAPATPTEVGAWLKDLAGPDLDARRTTLARLVDAPSVPRAVASNPFLSSLGLKVPSFPPLPPSPSLPDGPINLDELDVIAEDKPVVFRRESLPAPSQPPPPASVPPPAAAAPEATPEVPAKAADTGKDRGFFALNAVLSTAALAFLAWLLVLRSGDPSSTDVDLSFLPAVNASLNATSASLLVAGYLAIRRRALRLHKRLMVSAFIASALFLVCYVIYHYVHGDTKYLGTGALRTAYFTVLISHVLLSMSVVPLALTAFYFAFRGRFEAHKKVVKWALPIWLYVSVTGVVIFFMLRAAS